MAPSNERTVSFPALDAMRFIGAFGVMLTHVSFQTGQYDSTVHGTFLARLDSGVALFFVLSGFLLSRPYLSRMAARDELPHIGFYAWKRALRIVPVYVLTVVLVLALLPPSRRGFWPGWAENLTMTVIYTPGKLPDGLTQMWSLATEVAFYAFLPFLMVGVAASVCRVRWHANRILLVLAALCAINVAWLSAVDHSSDQALWLPAFLTWFSCGMALAVASVDLQTPHPRAWSRAIDNMGKAPGTCFVAAGAVLVMASTPLAGPILNDVPTDGEAIVKNILYALFGTFMIAPGVFGSSERGVLNLMSRRPIRYLGHISYGFFCVHLLVLYGVFKWRGIEYFTGHFVEVLALTFIGSVALSAAIYAWVETPIGRLRQWGRPNTEAAATPSAPAITI